MSVVVNNPYVLVSSNTPIRSQTGGLNYTFGAIIPTSPIGSVGVTNISPVATLTIAAGTYLVKAQLSLTVGTSNAVIWLIAYNGLAPADAITLTGLFVSNPGQSQTGNQQTGELAWPLQPGTTTLVGESSIVTLGGSMSIKVLVATPTVGTISGSVVLNFYQIA